MQSRAWAACISAAASAAAAAGKQAAAQLVSRVCPVARAGPSRHRPTPAHAAINALGPAPAGLDAEPAVALVAVKVLPLLHLLLAANERLHHLGRSVAQGRKGRGGVSTQSRSSARGSARVLSKGRGCRWKLPVRCRASRQRASQTAPLAARRWPPSAPPAAALPALHRPRGRRQSYDVRSRPLRAWNRCPSPGLSPAAWPLEVLPAAVRHQRPFESRPMPQDAVRPPKLRPRPAPALPWRLLLFCFEPHPSWAAPAY